MKSGEGSGGRSQSTQWFADPEEPSWTLFKNGSSIRLLIGNCVVFIQKTYLPGRYVAISEGKIIADAASFQELNSMLHNMGRNSADVLVVQSGIDYPDTVMIFAQESPQ